MAVAFDSVGPSAAGSGGASPRSYTHTTVAASTVVVVGASIDGVAVGATATCTIGGVTATLIGQIAANSGTTGIVKAWYLTGVAAGAHTIVVTCATAADIEAGSMAYSGAATVSAAFTATSVGTSTTASVAVTPTTSGNMVAGFVAAGDVINSTTQTSRWVANTEGGAGQSTGNGAGADAASTGSTVTMSWSVNISPWACIAVEVQPAAAPVGGPAPVPAAPGWQPGTPGMPGSTPFTPWPPWNPVSPALPPLVVPPEPGPPPVPPRPPASIGLPGMPAGEPFTPWPPPTPAVLQPPLPTITGLSGGAHGYFTDQNGKPRLYWSDIAYGLPANAGRWNGGNWQADYDAFHSLRASQGLTANACHPFGHSHTGCNNDVGNTWDGIFPFTINGSAATLTGQAGTVGLNAAFWARIDYMFKSAAAVGMTVLLNLSMSCDMPTGASHGFTNGVFQGAATAQIQAAAQLIGARYLATPNLIWYYGDDYFNDDNTDYNAMQAGIAAAGDTRPATIEYYSSGTTSRRDLSNTPAGAAFPFGGSFATFNWCYEYWVTYFAVEFAYQENSQIPVVWGDGFFYEDGGNAAGDLHIMRNMVWWALASGARGCTMGTESGVQWPTGELTVLAGQAWFANNTKAVRTYFEGLPGWYNLLPDLTSVLVTAGRGTRATYNAGQWGNVNIGTDNYVAASITPDGSLAVIYSASAFSITIDQSKLGSGYTATWVDPLTCATSVATPAATYNSGTAKGSNSNGDPDWVLVLQGPPLASTSSGAASLAGAGAVTAKATVIAPATVAGAGTVTAKPSATSPPLEISGFGTFTGINPGDTINSVTVSVRQFSSTGLMAAPIFQLWDGASAQIGATATGSDSTSAGNTDTAAFTGVTYAQLATLRVRVYGGQGLAASGAVLSADSVWLTVSYTPLVPSSANLAAAGAVTAAATGIAGASLTGAGTITASVTQTATATLAGAAAVSATAIAAGAATANLAAAGAVTAVATQIAPATLTGAGAVAAVVTEAAGAAPAGAGSLTAATTGTAGATLAGAGAVTDVATQAVTASLAGAGSVTDVATQIAGASPAGAGSVSATATVPGAPATATIAAAGAVTAAATQAVTATAAGAGTVAATVTQAAKATLAGAGAVSASGQITGTANLAAAGAVTGKATQAATASLTAAGALTTPATQAAAATIAAAGTVTAAGISAASIIAAKSSPTVTDPRDGTATVTDRRDGTSTVTAAATSSSTVS